ncbi:MAG: alpha/beta hydrolase [Actinomycetota bacterium]|nr:alpha/beta hydrolase [Actinomycetota bacterium]
MLHRGAEHLPGGAHGPNGFWTRLPGLRAESLFVWGRRDPLVPIRFARHVREALPGAEHLELPSGHVPQLERPRETHDAIRRFFARPQTARQRARAAAR